MLIFSIFGCIIVPVSGFFTFLSTSIDYYNRKQKNEFQPMTDERKNNIHLNYSRMDACSYTEETVKMIDEYSRFFLYTIQ